MTDSAPERTDRGQTDAFPMWIPAVIIAFILVVIMLDLAGVLPP